DMELPFVIALTKTDKLKKSELEKRLSLLPSEIDIFDELPHIVLTSSEKGIGIDELREIITDCCN
ncbi:MAG: YihA family ribosome biogenesis GTP-binding protein, partial [Acutalibacteraceae bacterium]|nr:YihA family ribosome biogenesis GTP-binding protein [Acutalibacteraceae bacterium]